jgi:endonuclease YncB( thermonuclease family)
VAEWRWPDTLIERVVDGDTVDAIVTRDLGFGGQVQMPVRLRLNRIDAYRSNTKRGKAARALVEARTLACPVNATTLKPYKYGGPPDRVGEWMVEIVLPDGTNLSDLLVDQGLAVYWDGQGPRPAV